MPIIADWRNKPRTDWSTNVPVSRWYTEGENKSLRASQFDEYKRDISSGDTLQIGVDWYGVTTMSSKLIPMDLLRAYFDTLIGGNVIHFKVFSHGDSSVAWMQLTEY